MFPGKIDENLMISQCQVVDRSKGSERGSFRDGGRGLESALLSLGGLPRCGID